MNELQKVFSYNGRQIRTVIRDGEPWWVAKDVCDVLDVGNITEALRRLDEDEFSITEVTDSIGRMQSSYVVNEPGLYSLILKSRKPEAKAFKRWITHEVIPAIRKTGSYTMQPQSELEIILMQNKHIGLALERLMQMEGRVEELTQTVEKMDIDITGNMRQQLSAKINEYVRKTHVPHSVAWKMFYRAYNTTFHTNVKRLQQEFGAKTVPEYLEATDNIYNGLLVANKMLEEVDR